MEPLSAFFSRYLAAFGNPTQIATFYNEPFIAARGGTIRLCQTKKEIEAFFKDVLEKYRAKGFDGGKLLAIDAAELGVNGGRAIVRWAYQDRAGRTLWESTFSYNLYSVGRAWKIVLQTLHDE
ncbi:MAG TPA: hypothetical protein VN675_01585 [Burkholderiales bacterium]|nr:hypothetical protein [Burkholderiales bacterium]